MLGLQWSLVKKVHDCRSQSLPAPHSATLCHKTGHSQDKLTINKGQVKPKNVMKLVIEIVWCTKQCHGHIAKL